MPTESNHRNHRLARYVKYTLIILGIILAVLVIFFVAQYRALRHAQVINEREFLIASIIRHHGPLTVDDVTLISPWMTFDYLNKIFGLPADYLKTHLSITDPHYPQISLGGYARSNREDSSVFLNEVENAVRNYLTAK